MSFFLMDRFWAMIESLYISKMTIPPPLYIFVAIYASYKLRIINLCMFYCFWLFFAPIFVLILRTKIHGLKFTFTLILTKMHIKLVHNFHSRRRQAAIVHKCAYFIICINNLVCRKNHVSL